MNHALIECGIDAVAFTISVFGVASP
jgi:hypothetical protein